MRIAKMGWKKNDWLYCMFDLKIDEEGNKIYEARGGKSFCVAIFRDQLWLISMTWNLKELQI